MEQENSFCIEIIAPKGLKSLSLEKCELNLTKWKSGYNGKVILRSEDDDHFEVEMDSSDDDIMFASGSICSTIEESKRLLQTLSDALADSGFTHKILLDHPEGTLYHKFSYVGKAKESKLPWLNKLKFW